MSRNEFSKQIHISPSSLGEIETGVRNVNDRIVQLICSKFGVNWNWIKTGNGGMFDEEKPDTRIENLIRIYKQLDRTLQDYLFEQLECLLKLNNKIHDNEK